MNVLLDSLEDTLETPRRRGTSKVARDFKIDTELSGEYAYCIPVVKYIIDYSQEPNLIFVS